ncbi:MAG: response regulator [Ktedonobacteraceae bacterium]
MQQEQQRNEHDVGEHLPPSRVSCTIVVVEDEPTLQDLLAELLTEEEHARVLCASSGEAALDMTCQEPPPHLLLLDYHLAGCLTGVDLYDRLHGRDGWQGVPAILLSANLPERAIGQRRMDYLTKPFDLNHLLAHVAAALSPVMATES